MKQRNILNSRFMYSDTHSVVVFLYLGRLPFLGVYFPSNHIKRAYYNACF
jgi:hypothetical protein